MIVALLTTPLDNYDGASTAAVLSDAAAKPFPRVPDIIVDGHAVHSHVILSKSNLPQLKDAAEKAGMWVLTDRWRDMRQGPKLPGQKHINFDM